METTSFHHRVLRQDVGLGVVVVHGVTIGAAPAVLADELSRWIERRKAPLDPGDEAMRQACRDLLRHGTYKPTGRGKPASEYLLRAALDSSFPRVNGPVDANNLVSLAHLVPVSVWDLDLAGTQGFEFRHGAAGESYVFNAAGQALELTDLLCGCGLLADGRSCPMVTAVKDSLATKLREDTRRVAGCVYFPLTTDSGGADRLHAVTLELERWLRLCCSEPRSAVGVCLPGETLTLEV